MSDNANLLDVIEKRKVRRLLFIYLAKSAAVS